MTFTKCRFLFRINLEGEIIMLNTKRIHEMMKEKNIRTRKELAKMTKIPYSTMTYMFQGNDMNLSHAIELAKFFQVPIDYIVNPGYAVASVTDKGILYHDTTSLKEALVSSTM